MPEKSRVLMVSPFHKSMRGNSLTAARISQGMTAKGFHIDLISLEDSTAADSQKADFENYALVHGLHALHFARFLQENPCPPDMPLILTTTGTDLHYDFYGKEKKLIEVLLQKVHKIVVFHQDFKQLFDERYPDLIHKLICIPQGIYLPEGPQTKATKFDYSNDDFVFLLPSGLRPVKNIEMAIEALEGLQPDFPQLKLVIVGANLQPDYGQAILKRINPLPWIKYLGEVPHEEMIHIFEQCHVVINCSYAEGQPQSTLEAMSLGKPCILTDVPGNKNIIENGKEGFYVRDVIEMQKAVQRYLINPELSRKMGEAASVLAAKNFSLEQELKSYAQLYQEMMK